MALGFTEKQRTFVYQVIADGDLRSELERSSVLQSLPLTLDVYGGRKQDVFGGLLVIVRNHYGKDSMEPIYDRFDVDKAAFSYWCTSSGVRTERRATDPTKPFARKTRMMRALQESYGRPIEKLLPEMVNERGLSRTAEKLGVSKATVGYWLLKFGIDVEKKTVST